MKIPQNNNTIQTEQKTKVYVRYTYRPSEEEQKREKIERQININLIYIRLSFGTANLFAVLKNWASSAKIGHSSTLCASQYSFRPKFLPNLSHTFRNHFIMRSFESVTHPCPFINIKSQFGCPHSTASFRYYFRFETDLIP